MKAGSLSGFFSQPRSLHPDSAVTLLSSKGLCKDKDLTISPSALVLYRQISKVGTYKISVVPLLDRWVQEGRPLLDSDLRCFVRELRSYRRYYHALEISRWMTEKRKMELSAIDHADRMGLIEKVHGIEEVENYFDDIPRCRRSSPLHNALLKCYVNGKDVEKAEAAMQTMKDLEFATDPVPYNHMLHVYLQTRNYEMDDVMREMEVKGIDYNTISYSIWLNAYADASDAQGVDMISTRMESDPKIDMDWKAYSVLATAYEKTGLVDKALLMLEKVKELIPNTRSSSAFDYLLAQYAKMGKKDEVKALWESYKERNKVYNTGYKIMISSILKCDDLETAEQVFKDWESRYVTYDMWIPNLLIKYYCRKGLLQKAEALVNKLVLDGKWPDEQMWFFLATGYVENNQTSKAVDALKRGLSVYSNRFGPCPYTDTLVACLDYLEAKGDTKRAKELVRLLRTKNVLPNDTINKLLS